MGESFSQSVLFCLSPYTQDFFSCGHGGHGGGQKITHKVVEEGQSMSSSCRYQLVLNLLLNTIIILLEYKYLIIQLTIVQKNVITIL